MGFPGLFIRCLIVDAVRFLGDISGVMIHILVGVKQLGAVNRFGPVRGQGARRQIGDLAGASASACAECARGCIPKQCIIGERGEGVAQNLYILQI